MEILRVAVPSGKQCNQLTTDNGSKYYYNDEGQINDDLFIVSANPLVAVDEAAKTDLGVVDGTGNIVIPMDKKEIKKINGVPDYLLVVESNPTDSKVLDAINKQNDPGFRPQIANEMADIEAQIMAEMNRDGTGSKMLFADSYSQAGLYDLSGNKVAGTESSFVGQNSTGIYFHDNVKGSASQKMKAEIPVEEPAAPAEEPVVPQPEEAPVEQPKEEVVENNAPEMELNEETKELANEVQEEPAPTPGINMSEDGSFQPLDNSIFNFDENNSEPGELPKFDLGEEAPAEESKEEVVEEPSAMPTELFEQPEETPEEPEEIDMYEEPEEPDALISDAIEKFEESYSVVENLKKVIEKRDEKYDKMVADYEKKLVKQDTEHHKEIEELNYKYDTDVAKLKNHGANWQSRYQRANARAEVLDEEGKKKTDIIEKLRGQLRDSFEETSKLKSEFAELNNKYEQAQEELKKEQKMCEEATEKANNIQEENNRLIKGRSRLIENMRNMTRQINSVQELVKGVMPEESKKFEDIKEPEYAKPEVKEDDLVDFSLGNSLTNIPVAFSEDENYSYKENI